MLKDLNYDALEIVSATRNISDFDDYKSINTTITMLREEDSLQGLEGLERAFKENDLFNEDRYVKLSCTYNTTPKGDIIAPIKVLFKGDEKYIAKALFERDVNPKIIEDLAFVDNVFETTEPDLKRVY